MRENNAPTRQEKSELPPEENDALHCLQRIAQHVPGMVYQFQYWPDGRMSIPYASGGIVDVYGVEPSEVTEDATDIFSRIHPDDQALVLATIEESARSMSVWRLSYRVQHPDGGERWLEGEATPEAGPDGSTIWHGYVWDVSERKDDEFRLRLWASVFENTHEGILITDLDGSILDVNEAFTSITGYARYEVIGRNPDILNSGRQGREFYRRFWNRLKKEGSWCGEVWNRRKDGELYVERLTVNQIRNGNGEPVGYVGLFADITKVKAHQRELEHIAHHDMLTGLPNRILLGARLEVALERAAREGHAVAVAYLDLDGFKEINDRHTHDVGDRLLEVVAARMKSELREGDTLARLGGDEFVVVLTELSGVSESEALLEKLREVVAVPVVLDQEPVQVTASVGVSYYPREDVAFNGDSLIREADQAMHKAKQIGRNRLQVFDPEQEQALQGHYQGVERLRRALEAGEFVLFYQPKVHMREGTLIGAEALLRWNHPEEGLLSPAHFLDELQESRVAVDVGRWVLREALASFAEWKAEGFHVPVSVNIDAMHLLHEDFVDELRALLEDNPLLNPADLELEILETAPLGDFERALQVVRASRKLGVQLSIDDFGTGYSSLTYLRRLPANILKIDRSFVLDMLHDPDDLAILAGILGLSRAFQRTVIAEGVETEDHGAMLLRMGCALGQGYAIARPMPADDLVQWARQWRPPKAWQHVYPVRPDNQALLYAITEHRAWAMELRAWCRGEGERPASWATHPTRLSVWLRRRRRIGDTPELEDLQRLHRRFCEFSGIARTQSTKDCAAQGLCAQVERSEEEIATALLLLADRSARRPAD